MPDCWVQIRVRKSTKDKLDNAIQVIQDINPELKYIRLSYNYAINRIYDKWIEL